MRVRSGGSRRVSGPAADPGPRAPARTTAAANVRASDVSRLVLLVLLLTGCDQVYRLHARPDAVVPDASGVGSCSGAPRQEVNGKVSSSEAALELVAAPTERGNTLVFVAVVASSSFHLGSVVDDGGNTWYPAVQVAGTGHWLELWYVNDGAPVTSVTATVSGGLRAIAASFTEWRCPALTFDGSTHDSSKTSTATPHTGILDAHAGDLVIGAVVFDGSPMVYAPTPDSFTPLQPFATSQPESGYAASAWVTGGPQQVEWAVDGTPAWAGGVMAFSQ